MPFFLHAQSHLSGQQVLVDIQPKKVKDFIASGGLENTSILKKSRQIGPEEAYRGKKELILSGGSQDRAGANSTKTAETMSAFSEIKMGPIANQPNGPAHLTPASPSKRFLRKQLSDYSDKNSDFAKLINTIRQNAEMTSENLQQMISKEYKIFRLLPDGVSEEVDFVGWASNLKNRHPIAMQYQNFRRSHFDRLRKEMVQKELQEKRALNSSIESGQTTVIVKKDLLRKQSSQLSDKATIARGSSLRYGSQSSLKTNSNMGTERSPTTNKKTENSLYIINEKSQLDDNEYFGTPSSPQRKPLQKLSKSFNYLRKNDLGSSSHLGH